MRNFFIGCALYAAVGIVTFGHAAAQSQATSEARYSECKAENNRLCFHDDLSGLDGFIAAGAWPLYWSWEAWS